MRYLYVVVSLLVAVSNEARGQEVVWTYSPPAGFVDVSPALGALRGADTDIVVGTTAGLVVALDGAGKELWRRDVGAAVCTPPTVARIVGDAATQVLALNRWGRLLCLDGRSGSVVWETVLPAPPEWGATALAVADLNGDGAPEIVVGDAEGDVVCLHNSGEQAWVYRGKLGKVFCPAIADLNGDGEAEVVIGSEKAPLLCLSASGKELWRVDKGSGGSPVICAAPGSKTPMIVTGVGKTLKAFDAAGKVLWSVPVKGEIDSAITVADADGDGVPEIYAADLAGSLVCVSLSGELRWTANVEERVRRSPSVGDIDGDGAMEILVAGYSSALHVFDSQGRLKTRFALSGNSNATATLANLDKRGVAVIVPAAAAPMRVLRWKGAAPNAAIAWPEYRLNSCRVAAAVPAAPRPPVELTADFGGLYVGVNYVKALVQNPEHRTLTIRVEVTRNHLEPVVSEAVTSDEWVERLFPYSLPATESSDVKLVCAVSDESRTLVRRERSAHVVPFAIEGADAARLLSGVRERIPTLLDATGIEDRLCLAEMKLSKLQQRIASAGAASDLERGTLREALSTVVREAGELTTLSEFAAKAAAEGRTSLVRPANPWSPFLGMAELNRESAAPRALSVGAFGGETESAALNVFNVSNQPRSYRVELEGLTQGANQVPARDVVSLCEVVDVPTERCDLSPDALPALNGGSILQAPAWRARQLWLNVNTAKLAPGDWKGAVLLRSLDTSPIEIRVPLAITVWKAHLPAKQVLRNCGWGYVESSVLKDVPDAALRDQVDHGANVFVATYYPKAKFDASGALVGDIDFAEHDTYVKRHAPHGIILFCGYQGALTGPAEATPEAARKAHVQWLRLWVKHLADLGVGYDGFALYPVDEPGLHDGLVDEYLRLAKLAREADPKIQMYTDPVGGITIEQLKSMTPYVDIWCPNRGGLILGKDCAEKLALILATGKPVWTYECDDNAKHQTPLGYYRGQAWLAWSHGISGIGFWSYCTSPDDPWFAPKSRYDYLLIYPGNGVVDSKRWEAVRDGIEDYAMLDELRKTVERTSATAKPEDIAAAKRVLGERASGIGQYCVLRDEKTPAQIPGLDAMALSARTEDRHWAEVQAVRQEIARLLEAL